MLEGTYVFPEEVDPAIKMLLDECLIMYLSMLREEVPIFVTAEDYQYYWKRMKEHTSSSYGRMQFRHYITAADSKTLSRLYVAKISEVPRRGVPLAR